MESIQLKHKTMVFSLAKNGNLILEEMTAAKCHIWHMATGVAGEAGELLDAVKKHVAYNKRLDIANVIEELGDLEFYMEGLRSALEITREQTLEANYDKLMNKRYPDGIFSNEAAIARADKTGPNIGFICWKTIKHGDRITNGEKVITYISHTHNQFFIGQDSSGETKEYSDRNEDGITSPWKYAIS